MRRILAGLFLVASSFHALGAEADGLVLVGRQALEQRDLVKAMAAFTQALDADPGHTEAAYQRGRLLMVIGEPQKAIADFTTAAIASPQFGKAFAGRAEAKLVLKDIAGAETDFDLAVAASPEDFEVYVSRATHRLTHGRLDAAITDLELARQHADPANAARLAAMIVRLRQAAAP
jgi:tetratricopeptide (TPR) repeat protein